MSSTGVPQEAWQAAIRVAASTFAQGVGSVFAKRRIKKEAERVLQEAQNWPLRRCVQVTPYLPSGGDFGHGGVFADGHIHIVLFVSWFAPFPAEHLALNLVINLPSVLGIPHVTYTIKDLQVTHDETEMFASACKIVDVNAKPDTPIVDVDKVLGPAAPSGQSSQICRYVTVDHIQAVACAPWPKYRDIEDLPDFSLWLPRWA